jgi:thioredoxin reductase (NADPH)
MTPMTEVRDLIIIGGGPAGYTAALYASRANLKPLCIEGFGAGGQLMITSDVENFPGFPEGILGPELMMRFREQAERFGTEFVTDDVTAVDFSERPFRVSVADEEYLAKAVIVATGATARKLGLESEVELQGRGVSYCAVCDAAFYPDRKVIVVGGGDSAFEEAGVLAKFAREVVLVHRRDEFRASKIMQSYARAKENVRFLTPYLIEEVLGTGDGKVTGVRLRHVETGEERVEDADGIFVAIGHDPNTGLFLDSLDHDEAGYLVTRPGSTRSNVDGVFVAGDVADHTYRQAVTAAGSGCQAALDAERWLAHEYGTAVDEIRAASPEAHW